MLANGFEFAKINFQTVLGLKIKKLGAGTIHKDWVFIDKYIDDWFHRG